MKIKNTSKEVVQEDKGLLKKTQQQRQERLEKLIEDDFKKYDAVFKALA